MSFSTKLLPARSLATPACVPFCAMSSRDQNPPQVVAAEALYRLSPAEELANAITHGIGLLLSIVGAIVMAASVWGHGDKWRMIGCGVYLASLMAVSVMSTLSHSFQSPRRREFFRALDQGTIYLLIAATYTPFALMYLRTMPWWILLTAVWSVALWGFCAKVFYAH